MKSKIIICSLMVFALFACNKNTYKVDVEITNANGKTAYLQKIINNETVNVDSCLIENNKAVFNLNKSNDNDAYHIFIKGWRRALPFFTDNNDVTIKVIDTDTIEVNCINPVKAITPGQFCVLYDGEVCLGGGIIDEVFMNDIKRRY